jgi:hypothetical protein
MFDTPLIETLRHLTDNERQQLDKFVHSRLFYHPDNASGVVALFEELMVYAPFFEDKTTLDRNRLAEKLEKTPQYIAKTASNLHAVVRRFIAWTFRETTSTDFFDQLALLKFYKERNLPNRFDNLYEKIERDMAQRNAPISSEALYQRFCLDAEKFEWMSRYKMTSDLNLRATLDSFEAYYLLQKAQFTYNLMLRRLNSPFDTEGYLSVLDDIERYCLRHSPEGEGLLLLFYEAILLLIEREDADFERFQLFLDKYDAALSLEDFHSLHGLERQYLLTQFNKGRIELLPQVVNIYRVHLQKGLLEKNGYLMPSVFANIVRYGCRLGDLDWVETFLKTYQYRLGGTAHPQELFRLYYAYFLIFKGQLKEAEENLSADFEDPITRVDARCFEMMILYDTRSDLIEYKIEAFRKLVRNTSGLPDIRREGFHNFALSLRKMLNPDLKRNDKRIDKICLDIKSSPTSESVWLISRLEKLKSRR